MKITEKFPSVLTFLYDNCANNLSANIRVKDSLIVLSEGMAKKDIEFKIDMNDFCKCYAYMVSAGYIENERTNDTSYKRPTLTAKAIDFIENTRQP